MDELIKVQYSDDRITVSARELHEFLEVKTQFKDWFPRMCEYGFIEETDFSSILSESTGGRPAIDYQITLDMAKEISMIQRNEKGRQARKYFIECEKQLKQSKSVEDSRADKLLLAQSKVMNAKARLASIWLKLADRVPNNQTYQQICNSYASEVLTGTKVLPLPECDERYYTATEIAEMIGTTSNMVGRKSKAAGIKPADENTYSEYGKWFFDKSAHSSKQVSTFKYNARGVEAVKALFNQAAVLA